MAQTTLDDQPGVTATTEDTKPLQPPDSPVNPSDWFDFQPLLVFVDVVYGGIISYIFVQIAGVCRVMFHPGGTTIHQGPLISEGDPIVQVGLAALALNYLLHDYVGSRLVTHRHPYQGRQRFLIDLLIAGTFLLVFTGAEECSAYLFVPFTLVFLFGAWWAIVVEKEAGKKALYPYPQFTVGTHLAAAIACFAYVLWRWRIDLIQIGRTDLLWIWGGYAAWVALVIFYKVRLNLPVTDVDMLPIGLVGRLCGLCWKGVIRGLSSLLKWLKKPEDLR
jgi:hypothetical protein